MADATAELFVKVGADVKGLKTGLNSAGKRMGGFANTIKKHSRAIGMAMTAMGAAIIGAGLLAVRTFAKMGDEVQKMALRTGFSTEALSELRHAAELSGASLAGLEKASRTLAGAILDAGYGLETYVRTFAQLGLSYEDLAKLKPEEQFLTVMTALAKVEDESARAALATDLFGRAGTQLLPMLSDGAEGLAEMRQEAHDLGIVFDQEAANKAAKFNDAMTKLKGGISGITMVLGELVADSLKPMIDKVTEVVKKIGAWAKEHPKLVNTIVKVAGAVGGALAVLGPLLIMLPGLTTAVHALGVAFTFMLGPIGLAIVGIGLLTIGILALTNFNKQYNKAAEAEVKLNKALADSQGHIHKKVLEAAGAYVELREVLGSLTPEEEKKVGFWKDIIDLYDSGQVSLSELNDLYAEKLKLQVDLNRVTRESIGLMEKLEDSSADYYASLRADLASVGITPPRIFTPQIKWRGMREAIEMPMLQGGGVVPGNIGQAVPIIAHAGETVIPSGDTTPLEVTIHQDISLDGEVISRSTSRHLGEATLKRNRMRG